MAFRIGVTGTRSGMTGRQAQEVRSFLNYLLVVVDSAQGLELHHGDCVGVDVEVAQMAARLGIHTVCHPPVDRKLRAFHQSDTILEAKPYLERNQDIVDACETLLVVPREMAHQYRGGTWYTHDYAKKIGRHSTVIWPR